MAQKKRAAPVARQELADGLDFLIRDTRLRLSKFIDRRIARLGIPLRLWFPLRVLYWNGGITQRELGRMLGYGDAHAGVIVRVMQRHRLVSREPNRHDKRSINLYLTPAGRTAARLTLRHMRAINGRIVAGLTTREARSFQSLLLRVRENLDLQSRT
jgi:DNA-binding MarR family transcriptional regulator